MPEDESKPPTEQTPPPAGGTQAATGTPPGTENGGSEEKKFSQTELEAIIKDRLERQKRTVEASAKAAEQESVRKKLEEQGEFKKLADQDKAKIAELEPIAVKAAKYEALLTAQLVTRKKGLPAHIVGLLDKLETVEQLEWIEANREALEPKANGHVPGTPKPDGGKALSEAETQARRQAHDIQARRFF